MVWYANLAQSALTPPPWVFSVAWPVLYILLAMVGCMLWHNRHQPYLYLAFILFLIQLILNWLWTPFFFHWHQIGLSFSLIIVIIIVTSIISLITYNRHRIISLMLFLYIAWLLFAAYLNGYILFHN